jgi:YD repeat-containing protein
MNVLEILPSDLDKMTTVALRKLAGQVGIKGMSSGRKNDLLVAITRLIEEALLEQDRKALAEAEATKPAKSTKRCEACGVRPIGRQAKLDGLGHLCDPCCEESGHENQHSDDSHDEIGRGNVAVEEFHGGQSTIDAIRADMERCWICHPELNKASETYVAKRGTSRAGMTFTVSIKASGAAKAAQVQERLASLGITGEVKASKGRVTLTAGRDGAIKLTWDAQGRREQFLLDGKKVRNISELYRKLGA